MDPATIVEVSEWPKLETPTNIHNFMGLTRYYQGFIKDFSNIVGLLTKLTKKEKLFFRLISRRRHFRC